MTVRPKAMAAVVQRGAKALREIELSVTTQADKVRIGRVWQALRALDDRAAVEQDAVEGMFIGLVTRQLLADGGTVAWARRASVELPHGIELVATYRTSNLNAATRSIDVRQLHVARSIGIVSTLAELFAREIT